MAAFSPRFPKDEAFRIVCNDLWRPPDGTAYGLGWAYAKGGKLVVKKVVSTLANKNKFTKDQIAQFMDDLPIDSIVVAQFKEHSCDRKAKTLACAHRALPEGECDGHYGEGCEFHGASPDKNGPDTLIGHGRLWTNGPEDNCHPWKDGKWALAQYGGCDISQKLLDKHKVKCLGVVDSERAARLLGILGPVKFAKIPGVGGSNCAVSADGVLFAQDHERVGTDEKWCVGGYDMDGDEMDDPTIRLITPDGKVKELQGPDEDAWRRHDEEFDEEEYDE